MTDEINPPREHTLTASPIGDATADTLYIGDDADDAQLEWQRDVGLHNYRCRCGETFDDHYYSVAEAYQEHLLDVGVLEWSDERGIHQPDTTDSNL